MGRLDKRTMIDRGRKAGLSASELYQAISTQRPEAGESAGGLLDGNGFAAEINQDGRPASRSSDGSSR